MQNKTFEIIEHNADRYIDFLKDICTYEARAKDKEEINQMMSFVEDFAVSQGFEVTRIPFEKCGDFLIVDINKGAPKSIAMMAHMDTVHDKGIFGNPPVTVEEGRMKGPGTIDCKGGATVALLALKGLKDAGYPNHVRVLLTTDEEISNVLGGEKEQQIFKEDLHGFSAVLNCETGRANQLVTERFGILRMELKVKGVGGHSGAAYFMGANAILEASHKIIELEANSKKGGSTYNCSLIKGGTVANNIPDNCTFTVDIRVKTIEDMKKAEAFVHETAQRCHVKGTSTTVIIVSSRPPMEKNADTLKLFDKLNELSISLGFGEMEAISSAGGADSAYTQLAGIPTICALGPVGNYPHTTGEYVNICTVEERAKLISAFAISEVQG